MCDPVSIAVIGALAQGYAGMQAANANADAARMNAKLAREQANRVEQQKARELTTLHQREAQVKGQQRVAMGGNGLDSQMGSGLGLLQSTDVLAKQDEDTLEWNSALKKWGFDSQARQYDWMAGQYEAQGKNAMASALVSGFGKTLGSGSESAASISPPAYASTSSAGVPNQFTNTDWLGMNQYSFEQAALGPVSQKWKPGGFGSTSWAY